MGVSFPKKFLSSLFCTNGSLIEFRNDLRTHQVLVSSAPFQEIYDINLLTANSLITLHPPNTVEVDNSRTVLTNLAHSVSYTAYAVVLTKYCAVAIPPRRSECKRLRVARTRPSFARYASASGGGGGRHCITLNRGA